MRYTPQNGQTFFIRIVKSFIGSLIIKVLVLEVPLETIRVGEYILPLSRTRFFITPIEGIIEYGVYA